MAKNVEDRVDAGLSTTSILDICARRVIIQNEHPYSESPKDYIPRMRGTLNHLLIEEYTDDGIGPHISEVRLKKSIDVVLDDGEVVSVELTGKFDLVLTAHKLIIDFKSCASVHDEPMKYNMAKSEHEEQTNIYRWLLWGGTVVSLNEKNTNVSVKIGDVVHIEIEEAGIQYMDQFDFRKVATKMWTLEDAADFIQERMKPFAEYKHRGVLPKILREPGTKRRHVLCRYCAVKKICDTIGE